MSGVISKLLLSFEPLQGGWRDKQSLLTGDTLYSSNICTTQGTLVQVAGAAQAVSVETGPCSAIHSYWKVAANTKVGFAACCSVVKLPYLGM